MVIRGRWCRVGVILTAGVLGACGSSQETPSAPPKVDVYEMRGVVEKLPTPEAPRKMSIRHETTKDMGAMTMAFAVAPSVTLPELAIGDKVAFRYEMNYTAGTELVTKIDKLPPDTVLNFGPMSHPATMNMPGM
jgi:Cu/Ag efflux protein CusF